MPATSPETGESHEAYALHDRKAYLEAAAAATRLYVSSARPAAQRLEHARLAQECFAQAYAKTTTTPRPEYPGLADELLHPAPDVVLPVVPAPSVENTKGPRGSRPAASAS